MLEIYEKLQGIMSDMGYIIWDDAEEDFSISDYIGDSLAFIQFVICIEEEYKIELSDDFLSYDLLESAKGFASKLESYISEYNERE